MAKTNAPKTSTSMNIITLKVTLRGTKPPVWRRLVMPGTTTLGDLHRAIQAAMGWHDGHLHAFDIGGEQYGDRHSVDDVADENRVTLNGLLRSPVVRFTYIYDFGDNWQHTVAFEKSEPVVEGVSYPICITGKRNCPPEDCGGVWGYEEMLANPSQSHPPRTRRTDRLDRRRVRPGRVRPGTRQHHARRPVREKIANARYAIPSQTVGA